MSNQKLSDESMHVLNAVQEVFRHLMIALAAESKSDFSNIGSVLDAAAQNEALEPMARVMLSDLADGANMISSADHGKQ